MRNTIAGDLGAEKPQLQQIHRVTAGNVIMTTLTVVGFWFIISRFAGVDFNALWDALKGAIWGWVIVALLLGQLARVAQAVSTIGASEHDLPLGPTVVLHFALTFINVAVPSTAARVAVEMRYYQKQGAPRTEALTAGVIDSFSGFLGQIFILIVTIGFGTASLDFNYSQLSFDVDAGRVLAIALVLVVLGGLSLLAIARLRRWVIGFVEEAIGAIRSLKSAKRVVLLFGGNLGGELVFALVLGASRTCGRLPPLAGHPSCRQRDREPVLRTDAATEHRNLGGRDHRGPDGGRFAPGRCARGGDHLSLLHVLPTPALGLRRTAMVDQERLLVTRKEMHP